MGRQKKSYLDLYLDNTENIKKKREPYFGEVEEQAILTYNCATTSYAEKTKLYVNIIEIAFKKIVLGVLEMKKFHHLPKAMNREQLIEDTFYRLIEKIDRFTPGMIGKNGTPVKAYSYYGTIAKNFILEKKLRHQKILESRADVESSIDLSILSEDTLKKMSNYDRTDIQNDDYEITLNNTKNIISESIKNIINVEEQKKKKDQDFIKIGYVLLYLLEKWDKIEFVKKNEFMRILTLYTGLKQQQVSFHFKKYKIGVLKKIKPLQKTKNIKINNFDIDEEIIDDIDEEIIDDIDEEIIDEEVEEKGVIVNRFKYGVNSMEEFDLLEEFKYNIKIKNERNKTNDSIDI